MIGTMPEQTNLRGPGFIKFACLLLFLDRFAIMFHRVTKHEGERIMRTIHNLAHVMKTKGQVTNAVVIAVDTQA